MPERRRPIEVSKVMDVTHPSNVQPSTTSRPVIVTNRPMIPEDPMINKAALSAIDIEKPAGASADQVVPVVASAPEVPHQGKTVSPISVEIKESTPKAAKEPAMTPEDSPRTNPGNGADIQNPAEEQSQTRHDPEGKSETQAASEPTDEQVLKNDAIKPKADAIPSFSAEPPKTEEKTSFAAINNETQLDEGDQESKDKTAEEKRQEELEALIAAGTYHVPIGQVAKRRGRLAFVTVLIIVVLVVAFNFALDMELFTISGVPHTNILR